MNNKKRKCRKNRNDNNDNFQYTSNRSEKTQEEQQQLYKQLGTLNLSIAAIFFIVYAILISIEFLYWQREKLLDDINGTNFSESMEDLSENPRVSNIIYLIVTAIFTAIIWDQYNTALNNSEENTNSTTIENAYKNLVAILLILLGTAINFDVLNNGSN